LRHEPLLDIGKRESVRLVARDGTEVLANGRALIPFVEHHRDIKPDKIGQLAAPSVIRAVGVARDVRGTDSGRALVGEARVTG
jgi:hypothetical protein